MKALLNDEGKKVWGYVFPDGKVVVESLVPEMRRLGDSMMEAYMIAWDDLTPVQRGLIIKDLAKKFKSTEQEVEKNILEVGLPLRASLVEHTPIPLRFLI